MTNELAHLYDRLHRRIAIERRNRLPGNVSRHSDVIWIGIIEADIERLRTYLVSSFVSR